MMLIQRPRLRTSGYPHLCPPSSSLVPSLILPKLCSWLLSVLPPQHLCTCLSLTTWQRAPSLPRTLKPLNLLWTWTPSRSLAPTCGQMGLLLCKPDPVTHLIAACRLGEGSDLFTWCPRLLTPGANPPFHPCLPRGSPSQIYLGSRGESSRSTICLPVPAKTCSFSSSHKLSLN